MSKGIFSHTAIVNFNISDFNDDETLTDKFKENLDSHMKKVIFEPIGTIIRLDGTFIAELICDNCVKIYVARKQLLN